jgi:hypothetical protein
VKTALKAAQMDSGHVANDTDIAVMLVQTFLFATAME